MKKQLRTFLLMLLLAPFAGYGQIIETKNENAALRARIEASVLCKKYGGSPEAEKELNTILLNYILESEKAFSRYKGMDLENVLTKLTLMTDSLKQQYLSVKKTKIVKPIQKLSNSAFSGVLKYKTNLELTTTQVQTLTSEAIKFDKLKRDYLAKYPGRKFNARQVEAGLEKILTEKQYTGFLLAKNKDAATRWAKGDWEEMKALGIASAADSTNVVSTILFFDMRRLMLKERYANNPAKLSVALADIDRTKPEVLRKLQSARSHRNPTGENAMKNSFTW